MAKSGSMPGRRPKRPAITEAMQARFAQEYGPVRAEVSRHLAALARRAGLSTDLVADMTQDTMLKWYINLGRLREGEPALPYVLRIAQRVWLDALRQREHSRERRWPTDRDGRPVELAEVGGENARESDLAGGVEAVVVRLRGWRRQVWELYQAGHERGEIAAQTGYTYAKVAAVIRQVRRRIEEAIGKE